MNAASAVAFALILVLLPMVILSAAVRPVSDEGVGKLLPENIDVKGDIDAFNMLSDLSDPAYYRLRSVGMKRDPFAEYGHFRFGKRAPASFADYGHLRFGKRRGPKTASFADYGHLRFGRSVDESEIYKQDFDDINDFE
ncbi:drosulfakinins-like [Paramacrobiotus metropolitanus]|uniref:drosulfakinins-like n=1 Tax=Paramacrobiotus metropolitanus TaxID=2943436 RepID=UPI002445EE27|nr:drosulfakinins-like [Paramacrobiotus metropolitanus]